jgi:hypothetical protein
VLLRTRDPLLLAKRGVGIFTVIPSIIKGRLKALFRIYTFLIKFVKCRIETYTVKTYSLTFTTGKFLSVSLTKNFLLQEFVTNLKKAGS